MQIKKYKADSMSEAMTQVRKDLGDDAIILKTKKTETVMGKEIFEIFASIESVSATANSTKENLMGYDKRGKAFYQEPQRHAPEQENNRIAQYQPNIITSDDQIGLKNSIDEFFKELDIKFKEKFYSTSTSQERLASKLNKIQDEIVEMKKIMKVNGTNLGFTENDFSPEIAKVLIEQEVEKEIVESIVKNMDEEMLLKHPRTSQALFDYMKLLVSKISGYSGGMEFGAQRPKVLALVGPTGVGKTTTIAKLAADLSLIAKKKVVLFSIDTFRIGAQEQIKTYSEILEIPLEIIKSVEDLNAGLEKHQDKDLILIDTIGRGGYDFKNIDQMKKLLDESIFPIETHLVLSAVTKASDLNEILKNFDKFDIQRLLFTKLDETKKFGTLLNVAVRTQIPVSYVTNGQNVPEDIDTMTSDMMTSLLMYGCNPLINGLVNV